MDCPYKSNFLQMSKYFRLFQSVEEKILPSKLQVEKVDLSDNDSGEEKEVKKEASEDANDKENSEVDKSLENSVSEV